MDILKKVKTMATRSKVIKIAQSQIGVKEFPANSNRQKYGKAYGMNGVFWCAQFVWWCAWKADGKVTRTVAKAASADTIQDITVRKYGGSYVMKKNRSSSTRKAYTKKAKAGDIVSFDFGAMDAWRDHVGLVDHVEGDYIYCIEGNTTPDGKKGSQSNGGMVALKKRHYNAICCAVRPRWGDTPKPKKPTGKYTGTIPTPTLKNGSKGEQVKYLQKFLNWYTGAKLDVDGEFGPATGYQLERFQETEGIETDRIYGKISHSKAKAYYQAKKKVPVTKGTKLSNMAKACAWKYGTKRSVYTYPTGKPMPEYQAALKVAYGDRKGWSKQTKAGASCDVFAGTCIRASGIDKNFPRGLDQQMPYLKEHTEKWQKILPKSKADLKIGDVIVWRKSNGTGHICIYVGDNKICEAGYKTKRYGCTTSLQESYYNPKKYKAYKTFGVYRAK